MSDQLDAETAIYKTHNIHMGQISMPSARFEPAIPAIEQQQNYASDRADTGIGNVASRRRHHHHHRRRRRHRRLYSPGLFFAS